MNRSIIELREVVTKLVPMLTNKGLQVTQRGANAYVQADPVTHKPVRVNIPSIPDNAGDDFIRAIQGFIDHEVAHVLLTDFTYYGGENLSPADMAKPEVQRFINTHNIVEDTMIEREIVKIFPGARRNIADLRQHFLNKITHPAVQSAKDDKEAFIYLLVPVMRALAGHEEFQDYLDQHGYWAIPYVKELVDKLSDTSKRALKVVTTTKETLEIARELDAILHPPQPPAPPAQSQDQNQDDKSGQSQDKPDEQAGQGDGDGERDHSESDSDPDSEDQSGDAPSAEDEKSDENGEGDDDATEDGDDEDDRDDEGEGEAEDDAEQDGEGDPGDASQAEGESSDDGSEDEDGAGGNDGDDQGQAGGGQDESQETAAEAGDSDDEAAECGVGQSGDRLAVQTDDHEAGGPGDSEESDGGGIGSGSNKSMFDDFEDDAFEGQDISSKMSVLILNEAVDLINEADYTVFTREMDRIEVLKTPEKINSKWVPEMEETVRQMTGRMQKDIERMLAADSYVIRQPGLRSGRLHAPNLHRLTSGDDRIFNRKQEHKSKDTAVSLLIDNSGSMNGMKLRTAMIGGFALAQTLERVSIANEVIGFTTGDSNLPASVESAIYDEYRDQCAKGVVFSRFYPINMPIYKTFDERINAEVKKRIAYMANEQRGLGANIDGESLEYAAIRLMKRREKRKVIMVLSDGQPAGANHAGPHLKMMVEKLTRSGIECIGIGIMDSSVKRFYPKNVVLNDINDLPGQVMKELRSILS